MKIDVKNTAGKSVGSIDLDDAVFGAEVHEHVLWEAVKWQLAKRRAGTILLRIVNWSDTSRNRSASKTRVIPSGVE